MERPPFFPGRNAKTPVPDNFCQGRAYPYARGATLLHGPFTGRALSGVPTYPRQLTYAHTSQNTQPELRPLTAPSAVHLTTCFLPDSQHLRLSVKASLPLSPLQRFGIFIFILYQTNSQLSIGVRVIFTATAFTFYRKNDIIVTWK